MFKEIWQTQQYTILFVVITTVVFLLLSISMSGWISKRVKVLLGKFKKLEVGDFSTKEELPGRDEFNEIEKAYSRMVIRLKNTIDQNYIYQIEKKEAELNALQYQINPHFLYNTLEAINAMAALDRNDEVQEITQKLGSLYRYNMIPGSKDLVPLKEELSHVKDYCFIQNIQMSGRLYVFYNIDEHAYEHEILKFLLQPIIENAIKHGFSLRTNDCCIEISVEIANETMVITITDDGIGMDQKKLEKLQNNLQVEIDEGDHIGLRNVAQRIRLYYGEKGSLNVYSTQAIGTTVEIQIPVKAEEKND